MLGFASKAKAEEMTESVRPLTETQRLSEFNDFQKEKARFNLERERGLTDYLESIERHDLQRDRALSDYKKEKRNESPAEGGPEDMLDRAEKREYHYRWERAADLELARRAKEAFEKKQARRILSEEEELDIYMKRPRFEHRKRALFGGTPKWMKDKKTGGADSFSPSTTPSDNYVPATPPSDFYTPPPLPLDSGSFDDFPPPPPPNFDDFPPPPPPPPPTLDDFGF